MSLRRDIIRMTNINISRRVSNLFLSVTVDLLIISLLVTDDHSYREALIVRFLFHSSKLYLYISYL